MHGYIKNPFLNTVLLIFDGHMAVVDVMLWFALSSLSLS